MKRLTDEEERRSLEIHQRAIVIDALNASIMDEEYFGKMQQGGVTATNYTVGMNQNLSETVKRIAQMYRIIDASEVATDLDLCQTVCSCCTYIVYFFVCGHLPLLPPSSPLDADPAGDCLFLW